MSLITQNSKNIFSDQSVWFLLISNGVTIFFAVTQHWNISTILWIYWIQSITIGFFNFVRILQLKEFSTEGVKINNESVLPTEETKRRIAFFFLIHYGFFHLVYLIFLFVGKSEAADLPMEGFAGFSYVVFSGFLFFINHLFSYLYNKPKDTKKQNIGSIMLYPYARIIPMHLSIIFIFNFTTTSALLFFLTLKTGADVLMHIIEHTLLRKGETSLEEGAPLSKTLEH